MGFKKIKEINTCNAKAVLVQLEFELVIDEKKQHVVLDAHAHVNPQIKTKFKENKSWDMVNDKIKENCEDLQKVLEIALSV